MRDIFPESFAAGLTFQACAILCAFPPAEGWTLTASLRGPAVINLVSTVNGNAYQFSADAATTAGWAPGRYWYQIVATSTDGTVCQVEAAEIVITPDLSQAEAGYNGQSANEQILAALDAMIAGKATNDVQRYRINNRELTRFTPAELIKWRDYYWQLVQRERLKARGKSIFGQQIKFKAMPSWGLGRHFRR